MTALTLDATYVTNFISEADLDLNDPTNSADFIFRTMKVINSQFSPQARTDEQIRTDVTAWLIWILMAGKRPSLNKRTQAIRGYAITQQVLCLALERYRDQLDLSDPAHFWLIERATRPLHQTARHPADVAHIKKVSTVA